MGGSGQEHEPATGPIATDERAVDLRGDADAVRRGVDAHDLDLARILQNDVDAVVPPRKRGDVPPRETTHRDTRQQPRLDKVELRTPVAGLRLRRERDRARLRREGPRADAVVEANLWTPPRDPDRALVRAPEDGAARAGHDRQQGPNLLRGRFRGLRDGHCGRARRSGGRDCGQRYEGDQHCERASLHSSPLHRRRADGSANRICSTVTVFARFRGWSTFNPRSRAIR